ncbi:MAG: methyltransferase domain-containing protein [Fibrobacter sp.]|nr:methyltransferase domain-containing protein [Fibrobacter sp.]
MAGANSVTSNQETVHKDLEEVVRKYARTTFLRPIAEHTREAFAEAEAFVKKFYADRGTRNVTESMTAAGNGDPATGCGVTSGTSEADPGTVSGVTSGTSEAAPGTVSGVTSAETVPVDVILDSGCGTGESTIHIARRFPNNPVIGIDKSFARLNKAGNPVQTAGEDVPRNAFWIRAELLDFWRLALDRVKSGEWTIPYHAVYYPNPWPKQSEATRRFHMHPIFPTLLALGGVTELRTNWEIYAREFAEAAKIVLSECAEAEMTNKQITCESFEPSAPETAFERKYKEARQKLWRVTVKR